MVLWRWARALCGALLLVGVATLPADAQGVVLHEFVPADPKEDVSFAATTLDGDLPAAIQTPSGVATAPDPRRPPDASNAYGTPRVDDGPEATYEPDRDTRRPNVESYDDPFSPATAPFKRLRAFDAVEPDYTLRVRDKTLRPMQVGGAVASVDEPFYGDMSVDLSPDHPVRIPTVGPGARILRMHLNPATKGVILHDAADNWFIRGSAPMRARLVMELSIPRATFGSDFADVSFGELAKEVGEQPSEHQASFAEVAQAVGISRAMRPREVVAKMVEYFRSFEPSEDPPRGRRDIYLDLALSKKGVCRHRSFAFLVTALNAGIPARMVVNEAHAWVEVFDGSLWHRIDLGGAALNLQQEHEPDKPAYVPPPDPYVWPQSRDSAQEMVDRWRAQQSSGSSGAGTTEPAGPASVAAQAAPVPSVPTATPVHDDRPKPEISISAVDRDIRRGLPLHVKGMVTSGGAGCGHVRVDVVLESSVTPAGVTIGSLSTDDAGVYDGAVVVPRDLALGEYELVITTPRDDTRCGGGRSQ